MWSEQAVSAATNLPIPTIRVLARQYLVPPRRGYDADDVEDLEWISERLDAGLSLGDAVTLWRASRPGESDASVPVDPQLAGRLLDALLRFDALSAASLLGDALRMSRLEDVLVDVLQTVLVTLGAKWACGDATIEQEHFSTNFFRGRILAWIHALSAPEQSGARAIAACAPDEQHEVGLLMLSLLLQVRGWSVCYLGQRVPGERLQEAIDAIQPNAVLFSATRSDHARLLADVVRSLPTISVRFYFGGQAFFHDPDLAADMPGTVLASDVRDAVRRIASASEVND